MQARVPVPVPPAPIPVAGFKDVYDPADVERALQELGPTANEALRALYEKMLRLGGQRFTVKPSALPEMQELFEELPNFAAVLEDVRRQLALCVDSNDAVELPPILLVGASGIGKTHFVRRVAQLIGTGFGFVPMSSLTACWILSGASSQWRNAKPGKVFDTFLNGEYANPVIVVDEIDKAGGDAQYDPLGALYGLLEERTAAHFVDEFAEIPIDASGAVWFATANDAAGIPAPILNRMNVYEIDPPDAAGAARIAGAIYREIRDSHDWGRRFPELPSQGVVERLVRIQLKWPKSWYPTLRKEVRDGQDLAVASAAPGRAAGADSEAEGPVAVGPGAPAIPRHRGGAQGPQRRGSGRPGGLPLHRGIRLGAPVQRKRVWELRTGTEPEGMRATYHRRKGTEQFFGFYDVHADCLDGVFRKRKRLPELFEAFRRLRRCYPGKKLFVVMDNLHQVHDHPRFLALLKRLRIRPVWTPTEASWLNLIEAHFGALKRFTLANTDDPDHNVRRRRVYRYLRHRHRRLGTEEHRLARIRSLSVNKLESH